MDSPTTRKSAKLFDWGGGGTYKEKYGEAREWFYRSQRLVGRLHGVNQPVAASAE